MNGKELQRGMMRGPVGLMAVVALLAGTWSASAIELVLEAEVPNVNGELNVYEMEQPELTREQAVEKMSKVVKTLADEAPDAEEIKETKERLSYADDRLQFSIREDGTELYYTDFPALKLTEPTKTLPSDKEALALAHELLDATGLSPARAEELVLDHVGGIAQALADPKQTYGPEKKAVVVYFRRRMDGLRVMNYGSSITVTLADGAVPAGLQYHWREVVAKKMVGKEELMDPRRVPSAIAEDAAKVYSENSVVVVDDIDVVLHDNGGKYIQPAYCYRGYCLNPKGKSKMPVLGYVPVLANPPSPVEHPGYAPDRPAEFREEAKK